MMVKITTAAPRRAKCQFSAGELFLPLSFALLSFAPFSGTDPRLLFV
jgi:hypothetical protein